MTTVPYPACQGPGPEPRPASFALPVGMMGRYPVWPIHGYTPPRATLGQYQRLRQVLDGLLDAVRGMPLDVSFAHLGYMRTDFGMQHPGFQDLLTLLAANEDRIVWGTDWPHPTSNGVMPNGGDLFNQLPG